MELETSNKYFIYLFVEKQTQKVIYVGCTARPTVRFKEHLHNIKHKNYPIYVYIREYNLELYKDIEIRLVDTVIGKQKALTLEKEYYNKYKDTVLNIDPTIDYLNQDYSNNKKVLCLTDNKEYQSITSCSKAYNIPRTTLLRHLTSNGRIAFQDKNVKHLRFTLL